MLLRADRNWNNSSVIPAKFLNCFPYLDEVFHVIYDVGVTYRQQEVSDRGNFHEAGNERSDADGAEDEARSAHDSIDGDSPASYHGPSGKD
jgi:hypothetical protein